MSKSEKCGFNECKSVRFKGLKSESQGVKYSVNKVINVVNKSHKARKPWWNAAWEQTLQLTRGFKIARNVVAGSLDEQVRSVAREELASQSGSWSLVEKTRQLIHAITSSASRTLNKASALSDERTNSKTKRLNSAPSHSLCFKWKSQATKESASHPQKCLPFTGARHWCVLTGLVSFSHLCFNFALTSYPPSCIILWPQWEGV